MPVHQLSSSGRLSREELRAELKRARERITYLEADRWQSHERLIDSLTEHLQDGFSLLSPQGVHLDVNPALCAMVGYAREELIGVGLPHPYWPPEEQERIARAMRQHLEGLTRAVEATFMRRDGERFPVLVTPSVIRDEAGKPVCVFGTIKDLTELKRAEEALRASEARYRGLVDGMLDGLAYCRMILDAEGRPLDWVYLAVNPAFERLTGLRDVVGKKISELLPQTSEEAPELLEAYGRVAAGGPPEEFEIDFKPLGRIYHVAAFCPAAGDFVTVFEDVSEGHQVAQENALLKHSLDVHRDGAYWMDTGDRFIYVNDAACAMLGYAREELIGQPLGLINTRVTPERLAHAWELLRSEGSYTREALHRRKDGSELPVEVTSSYVTFAGKEYNCGFARDISLRKRGEAELAESNTRLARALDGTVRALGATVDLRDPYTAGHERRVAMLAEAIAARLGWEGERLAALRIAALVHDVGKIAVPSEILSKPGRLSESEFALIRQHPRVGRDLLTSVAFELPVAEIVHQHHERLDGSGYPAGLRGDEILPEARVVAVADVVEAMISHRPYRPALPLEDALAEIAGGAGVRYDAEVAAACRWLFEEEGFTLPE